MNSQKTSDKSKPGKMFDGETATYYHSQWNSPKPGVKVYFGYEVEVSKVKIINRLDLQSYYKNLENTVVSVMLKDAGGEVDCGTLTNVNVVSGEVADQTYIVPCGNKRGIGVSLQKQSGAQAWCISELEIVYIFTGMKLNCKSCTGHPRYYCNNSMIYKTD